MESIPHLFGKWLSALETVHTHTDNLFHSELTFKGNRNVDIIYKRSICTVFVKYGNSLEPDLSWGMYYVS